MVLDPKGKVDYLMCFMSCNVYFLIYSCVYNNYKKMVFIYTLGLEFLNIKIND